MPRVRLVTGAAVVVVAGWMAGLAAQVPAAPQAGAPATTSAVIVGKVVDADSGAPVADAVVIFAMRVAPQTVGGASPVVGMMPGANQVRLLTTSEGKFVVRGVPAGPVQLSVTAPGYVSGGHGQTRPNGPVQPLVVAESAKVVEATIRVWRTAAITGVVTDDRGEPLVGIQVRALRRSYVRGQSRLTGGGFGTSDDRGVYRISGLVPGDYAVVVQQTQMAMPAAIMDNLMQGLLGGNANVGATIDMASAGGAMVPLGVRMGDMLVGTATGQTPVPQPDGRWKVYTTRYYPGVDVAAQAQVLPLRSGEERGAVDLALALVPTVTVSGVVVGPSGPMANVGVRLRRPGESLVQDQMGDVAAGTTRADGTFSIPTVPQGNYVVRVLRSQRPTMTADQIAQIPEEMRGMLGSMMSKGGDDNRTLFAELPLAADRDVAGLTISLGTGATLSGRIEFSGATAPPTSFDGAIVSLTAISNDWTSTPGMAMAGATGRIKPDGTFITSGYPPGTYTVTLGGRAIAGWFLKSVTVNGRDAAFEPFELEGRDLTNVVVTMTDKRSTLSGTVQSSTGAGVGGSVVVFPAAWREWITNGMNPQLVRLMRTQTPNFTIGGLVPGEYLVVAVGNEVAPDVQDPTVFEALARSATTVTLIEGDTRTITLRIVEVQR